VGLCTATRLVISRQESVEEQLRRWRGPKSYKQSVLLGVGRFGIDANQLFAEVPAFQ
jgi:hypothetical protein